MEDWSFSFFIFDIEKGKNKTKQTNKTKQDFGNDNKVVDDVRMAKSEMLFLFLNYLNKSPNGGHGYLN